MKMSISSGKRARRNNNMAKLNRDKRRQNLVRKDLKASIVAIKEFLTKSSATLVQSFMSSADDLEFEFEKFFLPL